MGESQALRALGDAGIPGDKSHLATDEKSAVAAARTIGLPVVMKIASPDILHKSDIGGVLIGLASEAEVEKGFGELLARARRAHPAARLQGCLVAPMITGGTEFVLGAKNLDPVFGPVVMVGLGGIFVEILHDISLRLAPVGLAEARAMLRELKGFALLEGARGRPPSDIEALARAVVDLSSFALAHAHDIVSCDINPFLVLTDGAVALDAVIVRKA